jgi:dolichol-phosphate mannosyltransferase
MKTIEEIAIVLPAYNEEQDLPKLLARIEETLSNQRFRYQVIVVDDGSKDRTAAIAREAAARMPLRLIQHEVNRGLGMAIQTGLAAAAESADAVITMDSDNSHDPANIPAMMRLIEQGTAQLVIASRFQKGSVVRGVPLYRQALSVGCFLLMKTVVPFAHVRDYSAGFRAYDSALLQRMILVYGRDKLVEESGFVCMLEVLLKLRAIGATAAEIPYTLRYDLKAGASKLRIFRTLRRYLAVVNRYRAKLPALGSALPATPSAAGASKA